MQVEPVKYSWQIIRTPQDLDKIKDSLIKRFEDIENVLPSLCLSYKYRDEVTAKLSANNYLNDTLAGKGDTRTFMAFLRRLFIVSGLSTDDGEFAKEIQEMYELANYLERNKDELEM